MITELPTVPPVRREGETVALREIASPDIPALREILGDPAIMRYLGTGPMTHHQVTDFVREAETDRAAMVRTRHRLAIVRRTDGYLLGTMTLELDRYSSVYGHSSVLRPGSANFAAGYEVGELAMSIAFDDLGVHRVWSLVFERNHAAARLARAHGASLDGKVRELMFKEGQWWHADMFAITADEWRARAGMTAREALLLLRGQKKHSAADEGIAADAG